MGINVVLLRWVLICCGGQIHGFGCYGFVVVKFMDSWRSNSLVDWIFFSTVVVYGCGQWGDVRGGRGGYCCCVGFLGGSGLLWVFMGCG